MSVITTCKKCGGDIERSPDKTLGTCKYCGSITPLPKVDDQQRAAAFNRGNHFRRLGEFDKALSEYERIVQEDENDAEAHWCCALCRFGIEYVKDSASGEYIPTCHRASFDSFLEDVDYKAALDHADTIARRQYAKDGEQIAAVQRDILSTVQKEAPFDVFICYKERDENGQRTIDSTLAQDIYYQLTEQGRRVFFSRITLEDKAGQEFEPYIFAALHSAKVMVVVGTKPDYLNAVWVKNEWSRYLALMKNDRKRLLIPCYRDMDPNDLPERLSVLQSYDMSKIGFIQDLIRGVAKVVDGNEKHEEKKAAAAESTGNNLTALLKRGNMALEDSEWDRADGFFEQALNIDAECAEAYWGKALANQRCRSVEDLVKNRQQIGLLKTETLTACEENTARIDAAVAKYCIPGFLDKETIRQQFDGFDLTYESAVFALTERLEAEKSYFKNDKLVRRAIRYADSKLSIVLQKVQEDIYMSLQARLDEAKAADQQLIRSLTEQYAAHMDSVEEKVAKLYNEIIEKLEADYALAYANMKNAQTEEEFNVAAMQFENLGDYQDSKSQTERCWETAAQIKIEEEKKRQKRDSRQRKINFIVVAGVIAIIAIGIAADRIIIPNISLCNRYKNAEAMLAAEDYAGAIIEFKALGKYNDAATRALEAKYLQAEALLAIGDYSGAISAFKELGQYSDATTRVLETKYLQAEASLVSGDYYSAFAIFKELGEYSDAAERLSEIRELLYIQAESLLSAGDDVGAAIVFGCIGDYQDAQERSFALWDKYTPRKTISAGNSHTVGLKQNGTVMAVGKNEDGQCNVNDWTNIVSISAGYSHTVGLTSDGTVVATGQNDSGQCDVGEWTNIVAVSTGSYHTVGLKSDGTVVAVGSNETGQCNLNSWTDIIAISAGKFHTVGLKSDGTVVSAGPNGNGLSTVDEWTDIVAVSAGNYHTVGLKSDGTVVSVGMQKDGRCNVSEWTDIAIVSAGYYHTVGSKSDGTVVAVGSNEHGQCDVDSWTNIVAVSTNRYHTVGLKSDGTVVATGANIYGQCDVSNWEGIKVP